MKKTILLLSVLISLPVALHAKKLPKVELKSNCVYFSPNSDKSKNEIVFKITTEKIKEVKMWELQINDKNGVALKTWSGEKKVPESISWNGMAESGHLCSDGGYSAIIKILDKKDLIITHTLAFNIDQVPPALSLTAHPSILSVTDEENASVTYELSSVDLSGIAEWQIKIKDETGEDFSSPISTLPVPARWVLELNRSKFPKGKLISTLTAKDWAGNANASVPFTIELETKSAEEPAPKKETKKTTYLQMTSIISISDLFENSVPPALSADSAKLLRPIAKMILESPESRMTILGHVDQQETPQEARSLSSAYAWKVFSFFVKTMGVNKKSVAIKGLGSDVPIADNKTSIGRMRNRRIELQIFFPKK